MSAGRYDPTDAYAAVRRPKALAPPHVGPIALKAEVAVMTSIEYRSTDNDALARYAVTKLISAMEHAHRAPEGGGLSPMEISSATIHGLLHDAEALMERQRFDTELADEILDRMAHVGTLDPQTRSAIEHARLVVTTAHDGLTLELQLRGLRWRVSCC